MSVPSISFLQGAGKLNSEDSFCVKNYKLGLKYDESTIRCIIKYEVSNENSILDALWYPGYADNKQDYK